MAFYFECFEDRLPPEPIPHSNAREMLWQFLAILTLCFGGWYIFWRWTESINYDAVWFSIPLVVAESCAYFGLVLFTINLWKNADFPIEEPPTDISDCVESSHQIHRPITVDVFFATFDEEPELVRLGIIDAKNMRYPHPIDVRIWILDDGRRAGMRTVAEDEGVGYITRDNNVGFKAGNLRNAMEQTSGDFILICDADTRPFATMLERTMGYFRDPKVAWVQTPQWFYDIEEGQRLPDKLRQSLGRPGGWIGKGIEGIFGKMIVGQDPLVNDPRMFYDVILRRRNWANASFCCGAGSLHRREAVMEGALRAFADQVEREAHSITRQVGRSLGEMNISPEVQDAILQHTAIDTEFTPYKFHVSEDIYTSIVLHSDRERGWKSVLHPYVESKMLSPQDLLSWTIQRFKYAGGSLDILVNDNPLFRKGLTVPQRIMYATTFWSYLGGIWNTIFLFAPIVALFTAVPPVESYSGEFLKHLLPFLVLNELATMVALWGIAGWKGKASYLAFFPVNLRAIWTVLRGQKIKFPITPKTRQSGNFIGVIWPQLSVIVLSALGVAVATSLYLMGNDRYDLNLVLINTFWAINNSMAMIGIVYAAFWRPQASDGN